jgi:hypothetical protein
VLQPNVPATVTVLAELSRWEQNYVDVAALRSRTEQAERDSETLGEKVALLERRLQVGRRRMTAIQMADLLLKVSRLCRQSIAPTLSYLQRQKRVGVQHHAPAALDLAKRPGIIVQEAGWAWPAPGFEPRTVKLIASLCTNYAIPATLP